MGFADRVALTFAFAFLFTGSAQSQVCTKTWTAPVSGLWTDAARWTPAGVPTAADDVCITVDGTYTVTLQGGRVARSLTVGNAQNAQVQTLLLLAVVSNGNATLTVGNGVTNAGAIVFDGPASSAATTLVVTNGVLANTATGLLRTTSAGTGARTVTANVANDGTVLLERTTNLNKLDGVMTNRSAFTVAAGAAFTCSSRCVFNQEQGSIAGPGTITLSGDTFNFNGGSINTEVLLTVASTLNIGAGSEGVASFAFQNSGNLLSGNLAAGQTLLLRGLGPNGPAAVTAANGFTNGGTIILDAVGASADSSNTGATLTVSNGTLINSGLIHSRVSVAGASSRTIAADIRNQGSVRIDKNTSFSKAGGAFSNESSLRIDAPATVSFPGAAMVFNQNGGSIDVLGAFAMSGDTFNFNGGAVNGEVLLTLASTLNIGAGSAGAASFAFQNSGNAMSGNLAAGQTVLLRGLGPNGPAAVTAANGFTNGGTIILDAMGADASSSNTGAAFTVTNGTLTNSATGLIHSRVSVAGASSRTFTGNLANFGTVTIDQNTSFNKVGASYANSNAFIVKAGVTLTVSGAGTTFTQQPPGAIAGGGNLTLATGTIFKGVGTIGANVSNSGQLHPGASAGVLNIVGNYTQTSSGSFNVELGGSAPGQFDQLNITGQATLAGTLAVSVINNFCPSGTFAIASYAARVGDFTTKTGLTLADGRVMTASAGATVYLISAPGSCAQNTTTTLLSAPNPSVFGQPVAFTATVTSGGNPVTAGSVTFREGAALLGGATLNANGQASVSLAHLSVGNHTISAEYAGNADFRPSSGSVVHVVNRADTAISLTSSANPSVFGKPVTFTATVAAVAPGAGLPGGTVSFKDGASALGTVTLTGGAASFTSSTLAVGSHAIAAEYSGDGNFNPGAFVLTQIVKAAAKPAVAVANENDDTVSFIDVETNVVVHTVAVGHKPVAATFFDTASDSFELPAKLYVAERRGEGEDDTPGGNGAIHVLGGPASPTESNRAEFTAGAAIAVGSHPEGLALSPDGRRLWVTNRNDDSISVVERATDNVIATLALTVVEPSRGNGPDRTRALGGKPIGVAFSPDGKHAYVAGRNSDNVIVLDAENPAILGHLDVGNKPVALAVSPDGTKVYAANRNGNEVAVVDVTDPARPRLLARVATGDKPEGLALASDGTKLYVTSRTTSSVTVFDVQSAAPYATPRATVPVGSEPWGVAVTKPGSLAGGGEFIYVTNRDDNTVSVIDAATDAVVATVPVGKGPTGVAAGLLPTAP